MSTTPFRQAEAEALATMTPDERARFDAAEAEEEARLQLAELVYAARTRAKQNVWLGILFLLPFIPAAGGAFTILDIMALPYSFVGGALIVLLVLLIVNALRE